MSNAAICAICYEDARPLREDLQSISACGHVFHELCLQLWMDYCPSGREPTCPLCKQSCTAHDVHRLFFQSAGSESSQPQVSPSRNLQTAPEDPTQVDNAPAIRKLENQLTVTKTALQSRNEQLKELDSQIAANLLRAEKAEAASAVAKRELSQCRQGRTRVQENLKRCSNERELLQQKNQSMAKDLAAHSRSNKELMARCNELGMSESRARRRSEESHEHLRKMTARVQELKKLLEEKDNTCLRGLNRGVLSAVRHMNQAIAKGINGLRTPPSGQSASASTLSRGRNTASTEGIRSTLTGFGQCCQGAILSAGTHLVTRSRAAPGMCGICGGGCSKARVLRVFRACFTALKGSKALVLRVFRACFIPVRCTMDGEVICSWY